jgi:hypothetical protein
MVAVPDHIRELGYPVAKDEKTVLTGEHKVQFDVPMPEDEIIYLGVFPQIFFGKEDKVLFVFTHIGRVAALEIL